MIYSNTVLKTRSPKTKQFLGIGVGEAGGPSRGTHVLLQMFKFPQFMSVVYFLLKNCILGVLEVIEKKEVSGSFPAPVPGPHNCLLRNIML